MLHNARLAESIGVERSEQDLGASKRAIHHRASEPVLQLHRLEHLDAKSLDAVMFAVATVVVHRMDDLFPSAESAQLPVHEALAIPFINDGVTDLAIEFLVEDVAHQNDFGPRGERDIV